MANILRANLELASESTCRDIARKDAPSVSSQPDKFISANLLNYYVIVNLWLMMVKQWSQYGWVYLLDRIKGFGLIPVIREMDQAATALINGLPIELGLARTLLRDINNRGPIFGVPTDDARTIHSDPLAAALFLFRFPKRFSPLGADILRDASLADFIDRQKILKKQQRVPMSRFVLNLVREEIAHLVPWEPLCRELEKFDITDLEFTGGVSFDTNADLMSKLRRVAKDRVEYFPIPFGIPMVCHTEATPIEYWGKHNDIPVHCVRISAVPKNYKTARIIAPEDVVRQARARRYFTIMDRYLPELINIHDQTQNQELALRGSRDGLLATLDLHAASDSITWTHIVELFPSRFVDILSTVLPTHFVYNDRRSLLQSAATMGNSVTFWLESVLFAGIALAATKYANIWLPIADNTVSVYGDDIIVPTDAAQTAVEFLEALNFIVNVDKSFYSHELKYRESCGEEYLDGVRLSSLYFPRFPLEGKIGQVSTKARRDGFTGSVVSTMTALVDLQHKMFVTCEQASVLLSELIRESDHRMTSSTPDEEYNDIWSYDSQGVTQYLPYISEDTGKLVKDPRYTRIAHSTPYAVYPEPKLLPGDEVLYDLYKYQSFLKHGPRYDDALSELLGVSSRPLSLRQVSTQATVGWKFISK